MDWKLLDDYLEASRKLMIDKDNDAWLSYCIKVLTS